MLAGLVLTGILLVGQDQPGEPKPPTAADKVKVTATATKPNAEGKQTLIITLQIEKGSALFANPVNHNNEFLDANKLTVKIVAKEQINYALQYPLGKTRGDGMDKYDIYEGTVIIQAQVTRAKGDVSPLLVRIRFLGYSYQGV
jgi:hypothetical protein